MQYAGGSPPRNVSGYRHPMMLTILCTNTITPWVGAQSKKAWEDQLCRRILQKIVDPTQLALSMLCSAYHSPDLTGQVSWETTSWFVIICKETGTANPQYIMTLPGGHLNGTSPPALLNKIYSFQSVSRVANDTMSCLLCHRKKARF